MGIMCIHNYINAYYYYIIIDDQIFGAIPDVVFAWNEDEILLSWDNNINDIIRLDIKLITDMLTLFNTSVQLPFAVDITNMGFLIVNITSVCSGLTSTYNIGIIIICIIEEFMYKNILFEGPWIACLMSSQYLLLAIKLILQFS